MEKPYNPNNLIEQPTTHYKALFASGDPAEMAERTGAAWDGERFTLRVLDEEKTVGWPDFADEGWSDKGRILFMRYLLEGKKSPGAYRLSHLPRNAVGERLRDTVPGPVYFPAGRYIRYASIGLPDGLRADRRKGDFRQRHRL